MHSGQSGLNRIPGLHNIYSRTGVSRFELIPGTVIHHHPAMKNMSEIQGLPAAGTELLVCRENRILAFLSSYATMEMRMYCRTVQ